MDVEGICSIVQSRILVCTEIRSENDFNSCFDPFVTNLKRRKHASQSGNILQKYKTSKFDRLQT